MVADGGRPRSCKLAMCVDRMVDPSGRTIVMGVVAGWISLSMGECIDT